MILPVELFEVLLIRMRVNLGSAYVHMAEHRLDEPEVSPPLQQMGRTEAAQTHYIPPLHQTVSISGEVCLGVDIRYSCLLKISVKQGLRSNPNLPFNQ